MGIVYADAVLSLRQYWKENGLADDPGMRSGLNKLHCFLQETDQSYSHKTALTWLEQMKDSWRKQDYFRYRRALFELNDLLTTGSVSGKYLYHDTPFSHLPKYWRDMVTAYRNDLKTWKSRRAITEQISLSGMESQGKQGKALLNCVKRNHRYRGCIWQATVKPLFNNKNRLSRIAEECDYGYKVRTEFHIPRITNGYKSSRIADVGIIPNEPSGGASYIIQVGRAIISGSPVSRERGAISDIELKGFYVIFIPYNQ